MDVVGGRNYHGSIVFEDGKAWLARFRLPNHNAPPVEERNFDLPRVYDYGDADDEDPSNAVGAGYILVERLAGKPLAWHEADQRQKEKFMRQLADIYTHLEKHPLGAIGRLQPSSSSAGQSEVGPAFFDYDSSGRTVPFGPFDNTDDYYKALIQQKIDLIKTGEIASSAPLDQYLIWSYVAIVTAKGAAFQSPLLLYNLGELYHEGLSTPSEDEKRLAKILQEETSGRDEVGQALCLGCAEAAL
ncbi:hypothetical protein E4U14_001006 [Claviceps sp. LM454 group G7]|nr:hypothetical protein E4U14_001006 [Claviceps sp. LM454 group G7]